MEPSSITKDLVRSLQYHPESYWCADCWKWRLDCAHLVEALPGPRVKLASSTFVEAAYDRASHILEVRTNTGEGYQYSASLHLARELVRSENPAAFLTERLRTFKRVRGRTKP